MVPNQTTTYYLNSLDSNNCSNNDSITVTVNDLPTITIDPVSPVCYGDSITLNANGGVLYLWSGGISNNFTFLPDSSTTYLVNGTDINGCQNTDSIYVQVNGIPTIFAGNDTTICILDTIVLNAIGSVTSYNWNNNVLNGVAFTPNTSNIYVVSGTDSNSCFNSDSVNITVIEITANAGLDAEICIG